MTDGRRTQSPVSDLSKQVSLTLSTRTFGRAIEGYSLIDSTNRRALVWAAEGAPNGSVVVTDHQTAGAGRHGRVWTDAEGANLLFSLILRWGRVPEWLGRIPLLAGVAVAEAIGSVAGVEARLKWPNDVLIAGKKTAGILAVSQLAADASVVVVGIGINVNQEVFPPELDARATSIRLATGKRFARADLLVSVLQRLEHHIPVEAPGDLECYRERLLGVDQPIRLRLIDSERPVEGIMRGVDEHGALQIEMEGRVVTFTAGDTTLRGS